MESRFQRALVTGGAGFIGSHVVDHLMNHAAAEVVVYDNFSTGHERNLKHHQGNSRLTIVRGDVLDADALDQAMQGVDAVFHFQANADVRGGINKRTIDLEQNTTATSRLLEATVKHNVRQFAFASSATVFGEPQQFPTPENCPLVQTSLYGASKLACEAMIQAYSEYFGIRHCIFRFVSWLGERYSHGVVYDLHKKLQLNTNELEILGDGKQRKSYLDVTDGVAGIFQAMQSAKDLKNVFNVGHDDFINVLDVADIICAEMGLLNVRYRMTGGERGWIGDSPLVHLDTSKLKSLGWKPQVAVSESVRRTIRYLLAHPEI